jgi:hypothetical protein
MIANILKLVKTDSGPPDTAEEPVYGRLVPPTVPGWSYPAEEHAYGREKPSIVPLASSHASHQQPKKGDGERPFAHEYQPRLARLSGLPPDVLRPVRQGHDYVGGMIASIGVVTVGVALLLLELT